MYCMSVAAVAARRKSVNHTVKLVVVDFRVFLRTRELFLRIILLGRCLSAMHAFAMYHVNFFEVCYGNDF